MEETPVFPKKEKPLDELLQNLMTDQMVHDVSLEGNDGVRVGACRSVLAHRSDVLKTMLFGSFQESSNNVVRIGYKGRVLQAIVEYIHTNDAKVLHVFSEKYTAPAVTPEDIEHLKLLVSLSAASLYFFFPKLLEKIERTLKDCLRKAQSFSFILFQACWEEGPSVPEILTCLAKKNIRQNIGHGVDLSVIAMLSPPVLNEILSDKETTATEYQLFKCLVHWFRYHQSADADALEAVASKMSATIHLEWIDPKVLSTEVESSGLVTPEQLAVVYGRQARAARNSVDLSANFKRPRFAYTLPIWYQPIGDGDTHYLDIPPIKSGSYSWTLKIEKGACDVRVSSVTIDGGRLSSIDYGITEHCSAYGLSEDIDTDATFRIMDGFRYRDGSSVTLTLDLRKDGYLSVSEDGGDTVMPFTDLKHGDGLVPAVFTDHSGRFSLVDIKKLAD